MRSWRSGLRLPAFTIVGLADNAVAESCVRGARRAASPVNLAPTDLL